ADLSTMAFAFSNRSRSVPDVASLISEASQKGFVAALRWLGEPQAAQDACQEASMRAWYNRKTYDPSRPFYGWYYQILRNHCFDLLRRRQTAQGAEGQLAVYLEKPAVESPQHEVEAAERVVALRRAIEKLPDDQREIIELRHFQDASYEEIADVLEIPTGTVMSRLYRARLALKNLLAEESGGDEEDP
ncbi:MAG: RNA polymerase sigma factor, partial [Myxococcales bacterium]|nr:RNA polymerase sigma factor [Myxococcales bacterium]